MAVNGDGDGFGAHPSIFTAGLFEAAAIDTQRCDRCEIALPLGPPKDLECSPSAGSKAGGGSSERGTPVTRSMHSFLHRKMGRGWGFVTFGMAFALMCNSWNGA